MSDLPPDPASAKQTAPDAPLPTAAAVHTELDNIETDLKKSTSVPDEFVAWIKERFAKIRALL